MNEIEWKSCTNPAVMLEFSGSRMADRQLKKFSVACYHQIEQYLTEEAKQVVAAVEAEVKGNPDPAAFVSACTALEFEVFDSSSSTLGGIINNYVLVLTEPPALEGAQSAVNAVKRVSEWTDGTASEKAAAQSIALALLASKLRDTVGDLPQPLIA